MIDTIFLRTLANLWEVILMLMELSIKHWFKRMMNMSMPEGEPRPLTS